jgi:hypothetical protein
MKIARLYVNSSRYIYLRRHTRKYVSFTLCKGIV